MNKNRLVANTLSGWSKTTHSASKIYSPTNYQEIIEIFKSALKDNFTISLLGGMRSYSDNFLNSEISIDMKHFNNVLALNESQLLVQSGVTFYKIADFLEDKKMMVEVIPGSGHVTIGGAISNNIHGKNAYKSGFFGNHVIEITYIDLSNFKIKKCSRTIDSKIFYSIISGLGVLGVVIEILINLKKIDFPTVTENKIVVKDIDNLFNRIEEIEEYSDYLIASIDLSSGLGNKSFAKLSYSKLTNIISKEKKTLNVFKILGSYKIIRPLFSFKPTYKLIEKLFGLYSSGFISRKNGKINNVYKSHYLNDVFLPEYNYYFKDGFFEYQCNIPEKNAKKFYEYFVIELNKLNIKPLMTGLKSYSASKEKFLLSFQLEERSYGFTFDFPNLNTNELKDLFTKLNNEVIKLNGKVYYAKSACLNFREFQLMYGKKNIENFRVLKRQLDPNSLLVNNLYRRIFLEEKTLINEY